MEKDQPEMKSQASYIQHHACNLDLEQTISPGYRYIGHSMEEQRTHLSDFKGEGDEG